MLALIAGTGALPAAIVAAVRQPMMVCQMAGYEIEGLTHTTKITFRIENLGSFLSDLKSRGVSEICFAGAVRRPDIDPSKIDAATLPLVPRIQAAIAAGDDGALRAVISIFEDAGLSIVAAHDLVPDLLCPQGVLAGEAIDAAVMRDIEAAQTVHAEMSASDLGQAIVVAGGEIIAQETQDGTDAMLRALNPATAQGGTLFKAPKFGQDRRADLPVIGPQTLELAAAAGLKNVVIEAMGVMVLDKAQVIELAKAHTIRLWSRTEAAT